MFVLHVHTLHSSLCVCLTGATFFLPTLSELWHQSMIRPALLHIWIHTPSTPQNTHTKSSVVRILFLQGLFDQLYWLADSTAEFSQCKKTHSYTHKHTQGGCWEDEWREKYGGEKLPNPEHQKEWRNTPYGVSTAIMLLTDHYSWTQSDWNVASLDAPDSQRVNLSSWVNITMFNSTNELGTNFTGICIQI